MSVAHAKKLIEVALPLPEINDASSYDKMPGIGPHPKGIHHWWARLPLPSARAVLFASVVTDPSDDPACKDKSEAVQDAERERLFGIVRRLMGKKLHEQPAVYAEARKEMLRHCDGELPPVLDPFAGGGSIPLEAARLGCHAYAADLNPVAVLLNKCNLELAPRWAGRPPVNPDDRRRIGSAQSWRGTHGLAADVRQYGRRIRDRAQEKLGHLYPRVRLPREHGGEANTLGDSVGAWKTCSDYVADCVEVLGAGDGTIGHAMQSDAAAGKSVGPQLLVSTDPPYYDNIGYAALSDFFYVWLRRTVGDLHRPLCDTLLVPKMPELTASPERFDGNKERAKEHFESGFRRAFTGLRDRLDPRFPLTVYYAFKQEDEEDSGSDEIEAGGALNLTTGWETLLEALISSGFTITATWPIRASQTWRMVSMGTNALASYIVLACRQRPADAPRVGRNAFVADLKRELPPALRHLQQGNVAPVDFAQAAIGPGMAVFSRYAAVLESSGKPMSVRAALALIHGLKDELLRKLGSKADVARDLAHKLFTVCEKTKRSADAQPYNALVLGWPELARLAQMLPAQETVTQARFL